MHKDKDTDAKLSLDIHSNLKGKQRANNIIYLARLDHAKLTNKLMITIAMIALIAAIGLSIGNMNMNAFARSSHHGHGDNDGNDRHGSSDHRNGSSDDIHGSSDAQQKEIISSSPGLPQQQLYLIHIHGGNP